MISFIFKFFVFAAAAGFCWWMFDVDWQGGEIRITTRFSEEAGQARRLWEESGKKVDRVREEATDRARRSADETVDTARAAARQTGARAVDNAKGQLRLDVPGLPPPAKNARPMENVEAGRDEIGDIIQEEAR